MVTAADHHDWVLVSPWYRAVGQVRPHRETSPVIQKYADSDPTTAFLADPQHSLVYDEDDVVYEVRPVTPPARLPGFGALKRTLTERTDSAGQVVDATVRPTTTRKLYLDVHQRFYLVAMEARLDSPELRCVPVSRMCEYGFVVRRITAEVGAVSDRLTRLAFDYRTAQDTLRSGIMAGLGSTDPGLADAQVQLGEVERALAAELALSGVATRVEKWVPTRAGVGRWEVVTDETPESIDEATFPMFPLVPDGVDTMHAGVGHALYFGLLPTASSDVTSDGRTRFDDVSLYEVRTFARRHDARCPRRSTPGDCQGTVFWSEPSERYQVADPFDPRGTGNRAVNIKLPDLDSLAAQVAALPPGRTAPARIESPTLLLPKTKDGEMPTEGSESNEICFFGIPLITIVAMFVFRLFLGIVLFVFNLWWMLKLKICIPPSVGFSADIDAAIAAEAPSLSIDADLDVALEVGDIDAATYGRIQDRFEDVLTDHGFSEAAAAEVVSTQSLQSIRSLAAELEANPVDERGPALEYEPPVTRAEFEAWERTFRELVG